MISRRKAVAAAAAALACGPLAMAEARNGTAQAPARRAPDPWQPVMAELRLWQAARRKATLWLRSDDTGDATPALLRFLEFVQRRRVPATLSVTPRFATKALAEAVNRVDGVYAIQHGYDHANHAPAGLLQCELDSVRPLAVVERDIAAGKTALEGLLGARFVPVMAPPWYCIAPAVLARLPALGYTGLSQYGARPRRARVKGLTEVNGHVEIINWRKSPPVCQDISVNVREIALVLALRRRGVADPREPIGIVSHHHALDENCWQFLEQLIDRLGAHPAITWQNAQTLFSAGAR